MGKQTFWPFVGSDFLSRPDEKKLEKMGEVTTKPTNNLILVTNIAPQATRDQMNTLFSFVGRVDELKLYPSVRDASINIECRCCFVRFSDPSSVPITQHLNNTVFIDRAVIVTPVIDNVIPDETMGIILSQRVQTQQQQTGGGGVVGVKGDSGEIEGPATAELAGIADAGEFQDPRLEAAGLPPYPALAPDTAAFLVNEVRRTVVVINVDSTISAQQCMEFFATEAGEVKFFRYCTRNNDPLKYALIEFSERTSVVPAMLMSGRQLGNSVITVTHAIEAIAKPQAKSNEAAQREIEEAMTKVKEAQSLVSAAVDPLMGMLGGTTTSAGTTARSSRTRSRSRSRSRRRSRSRGKSSYSSRRSRSRDRGSRKRSQSRERRRRSRSRDRHRRSRSRDSRRKRSKSRDRHRRPRSKSRDRKSQRKEEEPSKKDEVKKEDVKKEDVKKDEVKKEDITKEEELRAKLIAKEESRKEDREKEDRDKKDRTKDRDRDRKRPRSRSKDCTRRRSRSKERRRRSRSRDRKRSRSRERSKKQSSINREVKRDYDQEEKGFEQKKEKSPPKESVNTETQDMDISNSP